MLKPNPLDQIRSELPNLLPLIVMQIKRSYEEVPAILTPSRKTSIFWIEAAPHMRYASVQALLHEALSEEGYIAKPMLNVQNNCHHIEVRLPSSVITIHCTEESQKPRAAAYRQKLIHGQLDWFGEECDNEDHFAYFAITHQRTEDKMGLKDIRIILMSDGWGEHINVSILNEGLESESVVRNEFVAKTEQIKKAAGLKFRN